MWLTWIKPSMPLETLAKAPYGLTRLTVASTSDPTRNSRNRTSPRVLFKALDRERYPAPLAVDSGGQHTNGAAGLT